MSEYDIIFRKNMVECQLEPNGIFDEELQDAFLSIPREAFLPEDKASVAYVDEDLILSDGRFLIEPVIHARLLQAADPGKEDSVLNIGDSTGYTSAILGLLSSAVVTIEDGQTDYKHVRKVWDSFNLNNIATVKGEFADGAPKHAPYPVIIIHGSVYEVPQNIMDQLAPGGRLVTVVRQRDQQVGQIRLYEKQNENYFSGKTLFDAATPYLKGFEPQVEFTL